MADRSKFPEKETAAEEFLNEIKKQFDRYEDLRKGYDNKANIMISISGAISTILLSIGTFLISKISPKNEYYFISILILSIGIISSALAINFFIRALSLIKYRYALTPRQFVDMDDNGKYMTNDVVNLFRLSSKDNFTEKMIKEYLISAKDFHEKNNQKARKIIRGQKFLLASVIIISILLGYILLSAGLNLINLS